eukprot:1158233-Pelagomonas_calceolata.AAC.18
MCINNCVDMCNMEGGMEQGKAWDHRKSTGALAMDEIAVTQVRIPGNALIVDEVAVTQVHVKEIALAMGEMVATQVQGSGNALAVDAKAETRVRQSEDGSARVTGHLWT